MTITFTNARLIDPENGTDAIGGLTVEDGVITGINTAPVGEVVDCGGKCLAPGIVDIGVKVCEPGERHKESYRTAGLAAAAGGVTTVVTRPDTMPVIDSPEVLEFVARRARDAGAAAFTDCDRVVTDTKVFARCLTYARSLNALVIAHPQDPVMSKGAAVTSGKFASLRGLPAVSPMAERMGLERDLALVEMTGAAYHADNLSTATALPALERAKAAGLDVTAGASIHHLTLNELDVGNYRTFFKVKPPLRSEDDRKALVAAVASGLIDIISSMHTPQDEESKRLPYQEAASGAVALETLLPAAMRLYHAGDMDLPTLWRALSLNPAKRLGLEGGRLAEGTPADLVLFDPDAPFVMDRFKLQSKSKNTPFDEQRMQGKVLATYVGGKEVYRKG